MRVVVVASSRAASLRWPDASHPEHLPADLTAALREAGHEVVVERLPEPAGTGLDLAHAYADTASAGRWLAERCDRAAGAVLHALDPVAAVAGLAARSATGVPVVVRWGPLPGAPGPTERRLRLAMLRAADAVVSPTEPLARAAGAGGAGRPVVVPDGVDVAGLAAEESLPVDSDAARRLVTLSGPDADGGMRALLQALRLVPGAELVVAGRARQAAGDPGTALLAEAERCGVADRVRWTGWLPRADALDLLTGAGVVVCPRAGVSSAASALEAMCRARPVVAVDVPVLGDVVAHRTTGVLVRPADPSALAAAVRLLLDDPFQREALGHAGHDRVCAAYDWARVVPTLEVVHEQAQAAVARPPARFTGAARRRGPTPAAGAAAIA
jgi:glycosyltransferase involved in cell wall biosynthesis